jgi:hypothetical protein
MAVRSRTHIPVVAPLIAAATLLAAPAIAPAASSGGSGLSAPPGSNPLAQPASVPISARGDGLTLATLAAGQTAKGLRFTGTAPSADAGETIALERSTAGPESSWVPFAHTQIARGGSFGLAWRANAEGRFEVEATLLRPTAPGTSATGGASGTPAPIADALSGTAGAAPTGPTTAPLTISIYQSAVATLYGPGFYGHQTACGEPLQRGTLGVANRTLSCGTRVSILFRGRAIVVPVIDRGPYSAGADWDLTLATAHALGVRTTTTIGALAISRS